MVCYFTDNSRSKHILYSACAAATVALLSCHDAAANDNRGPRKIPSWYLSLGGGLGYVEDTSFDEAGGANPQDGDVDFDEGYGMYAALGYRPRYTNSFWDNTRFELELGVTDTEIDNVTTAAGSFAGGRNSLRNDVQIVRLMGNAFVDFDATEKLRPYLGSGVGAARINIEDDEDTVFAWQALAGMYYTPITFPAAEIGFGYRYLVTSEPQFTESAVGATAELESLSAHSFEAGVRFYF